MATQSGILPVLGCQSGPGVSLVAACNMWDVGNVAGGDQILCQFRVSKLFWLILDR